ncbi:MAG: 2-C-methyl-D-erythritol 2,4-cyclodiphosphate synthase [Candidatus Korobacteraceae bacterium]
MRIGYGWDSHEFKRGVPLKIGGVAIAHTRGLAGHSDGDVLLHALTDALLGAVAAGDIGTFFPPSDPRWKGADSVVFVREAMRQIQHKGYAVANVDSTLILAAPKITPHAAVIQKRVAELVGVAIGDVGVKAKTPEGMGTDNAAIAHVVVLLTKKVSRGSKAKIAAAEVPQFVVDEVVDQVLEEAAEPTRKRAQVKGQRR